MRGRKIEEGLTFSTGPKPRPLAGGKRRRERTEEELVQRTRELEALNEIGALINKSFVDLDTIFPIALEKAVSLTGYEMGCIFLANDEERTLEFKHNFRHSAAFAERLKFLKYGEGVSGKAAELKRPVISSIADHPTAGIAELLRQEGVQTALAFPLVARGKVVGTISMASRSSRELTQREVNLLESIGNQIGIALENAKLFSRVAHAKSEWESTFDAFTDLLTIRDKECRIIRANKAVFKRFGLKPQELIGRKCFEIFYHSDQPCEGCYLSQTLISKKPTIGEKESK